jgi:hypothetical protein
MNARTHSLKPLNAIAPVMMGRLDAVPVSTSSELRKTI